MSRAGAAKAASSRREGLTGLSFAQTLLTGDANAASHNAGDAPRE
jgi:hypothetical protein